MLNSIFSKKVQGQKHSGRWGIVEHQIPSIKMFKTNTKSHKHPIVLDFLSKNKTHLVNQRKQKVAFSPGTTHSPIDTTCLLHVGPHFRSTFKCHIAFCSIITGCHISPSILFTIHWFFNAWCLIIWLSEHRVFGLRLVLHANRSVTD